MVFKFSQGGILIVCEPLSAGKLGSVVQGTFSSKICIRLQRTKSMIFSRCGEASAVELLASSAGRALPPACVAVGHPVRVLFSLASPLTSFSLRLPATHPEMLIGLSFLSPCSWQRVTGPLPGLAQLMTCLCF